MPGAYARRMATKPLRTDHHPPTPDEGSEARAARLRWEAERLAEAEADLAAGRVISGADLDAFFDWFVNGGGDEPPPSPAR